jgi:hypothetical protein
MLLTQAHTLDVIFNALAQRAGANIGTRKDAAETYLRMALKAQSQCRTTLEALAEIKAPKSATFIKQANIAGQQQVNNGTANAAHEKNITPSNELLSESTHATLDTRGASTPVGIESDVGAVAVQHGAANLRWEGSSSKNAVVHGAYSEEARRVAALLRDCANYLKEIKGAG